MQRDAVAFAINDHRAITVRPDLVWRLLNDTAIRAHRSHGRIQAPIDGKIDERPVERRLVVATRGEAPGGVVIVWQQTELDSWTADFLGNRCAKHGGVKGDGAVEIDNGDVRPAKCLAFHGVISGFGGTPAIFAGEPVDGFIARRGKFRESRVRGRMTP